MKVYDAKTSFAGGELSPALYGRTDLAQYQIGAKTLENFIVLPQGSIINRPGLKALTHRTDAKKKARLIPFVYSRDLTYVLCFYDKFWSIHASDGTFLKASITPYSAEELDELKYLQCGKVMYFFHPNHWPAIVTFDPLPPGSSISHPFLSVEFKNGPFESMNTDETHKIKIENNILTSSGFKIKDIAEAGGYVGGLFYIEMKIDPWSDEFDLNDQQWVEIPNVFGAFTFRTSGKWRGILEVQRKTPDDLNWVAFKTYTSEKDAEENFSYSGTVDEYANQYRFKYTKTDKGNIKLTFSYDGGVVPRVFRIDNFIDDYHANVTPMDKFGRAVPETDAWAESAFSSVYGYPRCGILHQNRLILGGTKHNPQGIWMSKPASWHDFGTSIPTQDDDAIFTTIASKEINDILDFASASDLLVFTKGGEWVIKAGSKSDVFTPSSITATPTAYRGSSGLHPLNVGDVTLFVQRGGKTVRSIGYSLDVDGYATQDLSILSEHIFADNKIIAWTYQENPWSLVWCVLEDGTCAVLTFQRDHKVIAWTRQTFKNANILAVCSIPGEDEDQDYVYFAVDRDDGTIKVERMKKRTMDSDTFKDYGIYPVASVFESLDLEVNAGGGTIQGRNKHIPAMTLRLLNTKTLKGCVITEDNAISPVLDELHFPLQDNPGPYTTGLFSGDVRFVPQGGVGRTCRIRFENDTANPVQILGIFPEIVIEDEGVSLNNGNSE
ncbi:MAG: hypothetical protein IJ667_13450 [Synergistaceae bacterium]|nr:hypothetical protein [Synergistaceae bacterium]